MRERLKDRNKDTQIDWRKDREKTIRTDRKTHKTRNIQDDIWMGLKEIESGSQKIRYLDGMKRD